MNALFFPFRPIGRADESQFFSETELTEVVFDVGRGWIRQEMRKHGMPVRRGVGRMIYARLMRPPIKQFPSTVAIFSVKDRRDMCMFDWRVEDSTVNWKRDVEEEWLTFCKNYNNS